jgi:hypothetical protein
MGGHGASTTSTTNRDDRASRKQGTVSDRPEFSDGALFVGVEVEHRLDLTAPSVGQVCRSCAVSTDHLFCQVADFSI